MNVLSPSVKTTVISMRSIALLILLFEVWQVYPVFNPSLEKGFLFYFTLIIATGFLISAIGMWFNRRWSLSVFLATFLALVPAYIRFSDWDRRTLLLSILVLCISVINWKNLK